LTATENPLLRTKFLRPHTATALLARPRLTQQLNRQPDGGLTLLSAPAGFGKTTLVVNWLRQQNHPAAWLTLDEQDNDPILFWRYLTAALQQADERLGSRAGAVLTLTGRVSLETAVILLLNDITTHLPDGQPFYLVLDDFHWIHSAAVHQSLNLLLQRQPSQLRLLLLTRADPPLPLARLRVEGRLLELRAADLRLTEAEVAAYLNQVLALEISGDILTLLTERVEGWVAGLQLVGLSLQQQDVVDADRLAQTFAGAQRHIFAYLMEEILERQSEEVRQFLQQTAVLDQFSAPLGAAVTGQSGVRQLLNRLIAENLFVTPLDDQDQWYRYHPLFAEMLRAAVDEETRRACHRRAARWYAGQRLMPPAIRHALAAEDYDLMADLLAQSYKLILGQGLLVSLQKWLSALPTAYQTPLLRVAAAWTRVYESGEAELRQTLAAIRNQLDGQDTALEGEMLAIQAVYGSLYGQPEQSLAWAEEALKLIPPDDCLSRAAAYQALGNAYAYLGQLDAAVAAYAEARHQFEGLGNPFMSQLPLYRTAAVQIMQGRLHQALQTYELVRQSAQAAGYEPSILTGEIFGHLSDLYWEWNDLEQAADYARQEVELASAGHTLLALVDGYLRLAAVQAAQGERAAAEESLGLAAETAARLQSASISAQVEMARARYALAWGHLAAAVEWAESYARCRQTPDCPLTPLAAQTADLLLARVWMARGRTEAALNLLQDLIRAAEAAGRIRLTVEAYTLQALAYDRQQETARSQKAILHALALAKPEGLVRVFVENGRPLAALLAQVRHLYPNYVAHLLNEMRAGAMTGAATDEACPDPLTEREQDILALLAQGQSNQQIASALYISVGTVKGHINHIFSKLNAQNRTQALLRAHELGLIEF
jgi:LuxR family transcriptional regulator, maltose regulon positive regulatory protein